jgi:hypothetical protein
MALALALLCGEETWILARAWHHNRLTENTDLFYLSKRVGEETSVMNVDCRICVVRRDMYQEW